MRTDTPTTRAPAVDRLRAELARTRRRFRSQPPALRWSIGLAALAALVALIYSATGGTTTQTGVYVRSGDRFASDDLITVSRALNAKHVRYRVDDRNRVEVAVDQLDTANDVVAKLDVGPRSLSTIVDQASSSSPWDGPSEKDQRRERALNASLEEMIRRMDGVVSAHVIVNRPRPRGGGFRPAPAATTFVWLETENDRELSSATVESIQGLIAGRVPEVKRDAVSVFDRKGRHYLDALDPALGVETKIRHRRDELRQEILDKLDWLKGAAVSVQLVPVSAVAAPVPLPPSPLPAPAPTPPGETGLPPTSMSVNQPLELPTEPDEPAPGPAPAAAPAPTPASGGEPSPLPRVKVWVKVPRSYYLKVVAEREPSLDDLQPFVERTKGLIETAVRHIVPAGQLDEPVVISTIPDEAPAPGPAPAPPAVTGARRLLSWWVPAGAAGAVMGGGLTLALVLATRRPAPGPAARPRDDFGRYKIDDASDPGPGPSERVRELIRLNPEAAASVLHRWTGQGGTAG